MSRNFENQCNELNKFITIGPNRENMIHATRVLRHFIDSMKETDEAFKKMYHSFAIAGSYADDLKVSEPDEFDFLVFLKFPNSKLYSVRQTRPAHIIINTEDLHLNKQPNQAIEVKKTLSMCSDDRNLTKAALHLWIQQLLDIEFRKREKVPRQVKKPAFLINIQDNDYLISRKLSGPAHTLNVELMGTNKFSIDMVPAIFLDDQRWVSPARQFDGSKWKGLNWHAIPKVYLNPLRGTDSEMVCSYAEIERVFLHSLNKTKNLIRIFKKIRDTYNLHTLKSYHIKTVFLWKIESVTREFWNGSMEKLFFEMFGELLWHVENKSLAFFWDRQYNLFDVWTSDQHLNLTGNLKRIYKKLTNAQVTQNWDQVLPEILLNPIERAKYKRASLSRQISTSPSNNFIQESVQETSNLPPPAEERSFCCIQ